MSLKTSLDRSERVFHAAYLPLSRLSVVRLENIHDRFPKTCRCLLKVALNLVNEVYGDKLLDRYRGLLPEDKLLDFSSLKELMAADAQQYPTSEYPEILSNPSLSKETANGLLQIFEEMVENLINLSHLTTETLLKENMEEQALTTALQLPQPTERGKALLALIDYKIKKHQIEAASLLYPHISSINEKKQAATRLVHAWLQQEMIDAAVTFSGDIEDEIERNHALQEAAICMTKQGQLDEAIALVDCFEEKETQAYTLSRLVNSLATIGDFENAGHIAFSIQEKSYMQDAFVYIIKKLIFLRRLEEAIEIASLVPGIQERLEIAHILEKMLPPYHQDAKIKDIRLLRFS